MQEVVVADGDREARVWVLYGGTVEAGSTEAAIRRTVNDLDEGGIFCAVPTRSWNPLEVSVEVKRTVSVAEPGELGAPAPAAEEPMDETRPRPRPPEGPPPPPDEPEDEPALDEAELPEGVDPEVVAAVERGELPPEALKRGGPVGEGARY